MWTVYQSLSSDSVVFIIGTYQNDQGGLEVGEVKP